MSLNNWAFVWSLRKSGFAFHQPPPPPFVFRKTLKSFEVNIEYLIELPTAIDFVNFCLCDTSTEIIKFKRKVVFCASIKERWGKGERGGKQKFTFVYCLVNVGYLLSRTCVPYNHSIHLQKIEKCNWKHQIREKWMEGSVRKFLPESSKERNLRGENEFCNDPMQILDILRCWKHFSRSAELCELPWGWKRVERAFQGSLWGKWATSTFNRRLKKGGKKLKIWLKKSKNFQVSSKFWSFIKNF